MTLKWVRVDDLEPDGCYENRWAYRLYTRADGWILERQYAQGDRYLNRPRITWTATRWNGNGWGCEFFDTMTQAKTWVETKEAAAYVARIEKKES